MTIPITTATADNPVMKRVAGAVRSGTWLHSGALHTNFPMISVIGLIR